MTNDLAYQNKRMHIMDAAVAQFCERGYYGTTIPQIATKAGIAVGTIYRYFETKEELVNDLYKYHKRHYLKFLQEDFPDHLEPREKFHALWQKLVGFVEANPLSFTFLELHHHGPYLEADTLKLEDEFWAWLLTIFMDALAKGMIKEGPPDLLITLVWWSFVGMVKTSQTRGSKLSDEEVLLAENCCWQMLSK